MTVLKRVLIGLVVVVGGYVLVTRLWNRWRAKKQPPEGSPPPASPSPPAVPTTPATQQRTP